MKSLDVEFDKQKLIRLRNKILTMKESRTKALLINNYRIYSHYIYAKTADEQFANHQYDFDTCPSYVKYIRTSIKDEIDLANSIDILSDIFTEIVNFNTQEGVHQYLKLDNYINEQLGFELIEEFFATLSPYLYKIYKNTIKDNIAYLSLDGAYACDVSYYDQPKIISYNDLKSYETYKALVHELGHCYQFILNSKSNNTYFDQIDVEVPSIFMETIFNLYVQKRLYNKNYGLSSILTRQSLMAYTTSIHRLLFSCCKNQQIQDRVVYGEIIINDLTPNEINVLENACGHKINKNRESLTFGIDINTFKYTISNLLAIKFVDIYLQDKQAGLRLLKDYIMLPPSVTLKEKLSVYQIDSYQRFNKPIYEYGRKIHRL